MTEEALSQCPERIKILCADKEWYQLHGEALDRDRSNCYLAGRDLIDDLSSLDTHQGVLLVVEKPPLPRNCTIESGLAVYLDGVQDPGNVGTMIRTVDWFGMDKIYYGPGTVDPFNSKVVQSSMGSLFRVQPISSTIDRLIEEGGQSVICTAAALQGMSVYDWEPKSPELLVIGNEGSGLSEAVGAKVDRSVHIPGAADGIHAESLNAAVSCGILISHWMGKRKGKPAD